MAKKPYEGQRGWRVVVVYDETTMDLDPSLPPPWWPNYQYDGGEIVVWAHRFYRCRAPILWGGAFDDDQNRAAWIDITGGHTDIRDLLPDAVGVEGQTVTAEILPNRRLYVDTRNAPVNVKLPPPGSWADGDLIEIVDDYRAFDKHPCTLVANGVRINLVVQDSADEPQNAPLDIVGTQDYWRFVYYINPANPADQWLYSMSAPTAASGGSTDQGGGLKPVVVTGPADATLSPNTLVIAQTNNGPITFTPDNTFQDGDLFTIIDFDWTFGKTDDQGNPTNAAVLKPTPTSTYQDGDPDDGKFYMNVKGPSSGWQFLYYGGRVLCLNAPLNQEWIDAITRAVNGDAAEQANAAPSGDLAPTGALLDLAAPVAAPVFDAPMTFTFTTIKTTTDVAPAAPWTQYDVDLGRKKSLTVTLPPVQSIPPRARIRVRVVSAGQGVVNVQPGPDDQILGLFGTVNATPKGKPRTVHGQYNMIELEADGAGEWLVV